MTGCKKCTKDWYCLHYPNGKVYHSWYEIILCDECKKEKEKA